MHINNQLEEEKMHYKLRKVALHASSRVWEELDQDNIQGQISLGHA
jgi:hypothetical protein